MAPTITEHRRAQRISHLQRANDVRVARAALRHRIAARQVTAAQVLAEPPAEALSWQIGDLLSSQWRWGPSRSSRFLNRLRISWTRPVGALTDRQRARIGRALSGGPVVRRCKECGCVDAAACTRPGAIANEVVCCHWVADDLCSACLEEQLIAAAGSDPTATDWTHPPRQVTDQIAALEEAV